MRPYSWLIPTVSAALIGIGAVIGAAAALPPGVPGTVTPQQRSYVIGRDRQMTVTVELPNSCAGTLVELRFYQPAADGSNGLVPVTEPALAAITATARAATGSFSVVLPLPAALPGDPVRVLPGVSGGCLATPVYDPGLGVDLAKLDPVENPGNTSTIVVLGAALRWVSPTNPDKTTLGAFTGSITVMANGVACSSVKLGKAAVTDAAGNVRIHLGSAGQPIQCSTAGASLTFVRADGATLYEKRTLLPGVTQMIQNLAPEAPFDGPTATATAAKTVAPIPPNTGSEGPSTGPAGSDSSPWLLALGGLAVLLGVVGAGLMFRRR